MFLELRMQYGATRIPFFWFPVLRPSSVTARTPRCICTTLATLLCKLIIPKSPVPSGIPAAANWRHKRGQHNGRLRVAQRVP